MFIKTLRKEEVNGHYHGGISSKFRMQFVYVVLQRNISKIIEYALTIRGTNTAVERTFSNTNILRSDKKNRFFINTIKSINMVKNYSCNEFSNFLLKNN